MVERESMTICPICIPFFGQPRSDETCVHSVAKRHASLKDSDSDEMYTHLVEKSV